MYLTGVISKLTLYLPCPFDQELSEYIPNNSNNRSVCRSANNYHQQFSKQCRLNSLEEVSACVSNPNVNINIYNGFFQRNIHIAKCTYLIAFTLGSSHDQSQDYIYDVDDIGDIGLVKGGTANTWNEASKNKVIKIHIPIESL